MKVLWLCNYILPKAALDLGIEGIPKEGWVEGLLDALKNSRTMTDESGNNASAAKNGDITIAVCFPVPEYLDGKKGTLFLSENTNSQTEKRNIEADSPFSAYYYCFSEDTVHPEKYDLLLESKMNRILDDFRPDLIHIFGTEFPHTLAMMKAATGDDFHYHLSKEKIFITFQGVCSAIAADYISSLPDKVAGAKTFRDSVRKDSIMDQQDKFRKRAALELESMKLAGNIGGRTDFDKKWAGRLSPDAKYHNAGEVMRKIFYEPLPVETRHNENVIFVAGADYPIKGFHFLLTALKDIRWPELKIRVAGQDIVSKSKIKISGYGKYLSELIEKCGLTGKVEFLGRISADKMRDEYLNCGTFICPSSIENSPNSIVEAALMGAPVIASRVGGIPSIIEDKKECLLYECSARKTLEENALALRACIEAVKADYDSALKRAENARARMLKDHDPATVASQILDIYSEM